MTSRISTDLVAPLLWVQPAIRQPARCLRRGLADWKPHPANTPGGDRVGLGGNRGHIG